jgi:hypothetical protein
MKKSSKQHLDARARAGELDARQLAQVEGGTVVIPGKGDDGQGPK